MTNRHKLFAFFLLCQSCQGTENFPKDPVRYPSISKAYLRDSIYLAYTVRQFIDRDVQGYGSVRKEDYLRVDIDTILYSADRLKLFSFDITYLKDDNDKEQPYCYFGQTLIGYRMDTQTAWTIYPGHTFAEFVGYANYNKVKNRLRLEFFHKFKDESRWYWNNEQHERQQFYYKYNVNDLSFWDSCYIWKKGVSIPELYIFQQKGNVKPDGDDIIFTLPTIRYPDSLLRSYSL